MQKPILPRRFELTDRPRVMAWLDESGSARTARIETAIKTVSALIEGAVLHTEIQAGIRKETPAFMFGAQHLRLAAAPIYPDRGLTIRFDPAQAFGEGTEVDPAEYRVPAQLAEIGIIETRDPIEARDHGTIQVEYSGGMAKDLDELDRDYPHVVTAATIWAADFVARPDRPEKTSGRTLEQVLLDEMPPKAAALLAPYSRARFFQ